MQQTTQNIHPLFSINGVRFTKENVSSFFQKLKEEDNYQVAVCKFIEEWLKPSKTIQVRTSGSTGKPKEITLLKKHMIASAKATGAFFNLPQETSALLCLPVEYIAGKMMLVRAMVLGWNLDVVTPGKDILAKADITYDFAAMVPYQVFHSINEIHKVAKLIIGGGAISSKLTERLQHVPTTVFETYGMTETITHIAVKSSNGPQASHYFRALPGITFQQDERGCLIINALQISDYPVITNDMVDLSDINSFKLLGRYDNVINSGGVKVYPEVVEAKLAKFIDIPFIILSEPNDALGEQVILVLATENQEEIHAYNEAFDTLQRYERPKKVYLLTQFPYTDTGKIKRKDIQEKLREIDR